MLNRDRSADVGFDVVHAGPQAVDDHADLVRRMGEGRAFVLVDDPEGGEVRRYVKSASSRSRMSARIVDVTDAIHTAQQQAEMASQLSAYAGAAWISGGGSAVIGAGKTIAVLATNGRGYRGGALKDPPRTHIAIPVGLGPAEECTSIVVDQRTQQKIVDDRVRALSVIDARLFPDYDPAIEQYKLQAIVLACMATDGSASLRDHTLALLAAHHLVAPDPSPVDIRHGLTLATAAHRRWPLCLRCRAGTVFPSAVFTYETRSPAHLCLLEAVARGLSVGKTYRCCLAPLRPAFPDSGCRTRRREFASRPRDG